MIHLSKVLSAVSIRLRSKALPSTAWPSTAFSFSVLPLSALLSTVSINRALKLTLPLLASCAIANAGSPEAPTAPDAVEIENLAVKQSLIGKVGDPVDGRKVFANKKLGNCLACHKNADLADQLFHGEVGPSLDGVASRWSEAQLRTIVINAKAVFTSETVMPGFYSLEVGEDVREDLIGRTILTAQQVEDVVAYLATLK